MANPLFEAKDFSYGDLAALVHKIGRDNTRKLLSCKRVTVEFRENGQAVIGAEPQQFPVWRTIKVGTKLKTTDHFRAALKEGDYRVSSWANDLLDRPEFVTATEEHEVDLALVSVEELGFEDPDDDGIEYQDICARVLDLGLELCEPEDGPQLQLQYPDQPKGEWVIMVMKAIRGSDGDLLLFRVEHDDGGRWLDDCYGSPGVRFSRRHRFVVRVPRKS